MILDVIPLDASSLEIALRQIDYGVKCIQRAVARVENDRFTPAELSPQISDYLIDLTIKYPNDGSEFANFLVSLPRDAIENELLRQILPEPIRQTTLDHRTKHDQFQSQQENEIANGHFDNARDYRDRQEQLALSIRELIADQQLIITPQLIDSVLKKLGYDESQK